MGYHGYHFWFIQPCPKIVRKIASVRWLRQERDRLQAMGMTKLGRMGLIFIDAKVKINGAYCREVLLTQKLLPVIHDEHNIS